MSILRDLTGQRIGKLAVLYREGSDAKGGATWRCLCDCGNQKVVSGELLKLSKVKSCGCLSDLTGKRFDKLVVLNKVENQGKSSAWKCLCDCGVICIFSSVKLTDKRRKFIRSCGCLLTEQRQKAQTRHGLSRTSTYHIWQGLIQRCINPNGSGYKDYGGRGIKVCDRWLASFENFLEDMGERPKGMTLDRYPDTNGNYEPNNCRWATPMEQGGNKRNNVYWEYNGRRMHIAQWAREIGINKTALRRRVTEQGMTVEQALTTPRREDKVHYVKNSNR